MFTNLSSNELSKIIGGSTREEYCATLSTLIQYNWGTWSEEERASAVNAYQKFCIDDIEGPIN